MPKNKQVLLRRIKKKVFDEKGRVISEKIVEEYGSLVSSVGIPGPPGPPGPMGPKGEPGSVGGPAQVGWPWYENIAGSTVGINTNTSPVVHIKKEGDTTWEEAGLIPFPEDDPGVE